MSKPKKGRKWLVGVLVTLVALPILFFPFKLNFLDGGTTMYCALTYRVNKWNCLGSDYEKRQSFHLVGKSVYVFPFNLHDYEWYYERDKDKLVRVDIHDMLTMPSEQE